MRNWDSQTWSYNSNRFSQFRILDSHKDTTTSAASSLDATKRQSPAGWPRTRPAAASRFYRTCSRGDESGIAGALERAVSRACLPSFHSGPTFNARGRLSPWCQRSRPPWWGIQCTVSWVINRWGPVFRARACPSCFNSSSLIPGRCTLLRQHGRGESLQEGALRSPLTPREMLPQNHVAEFPALPPSPTVESVLTKCMLGSLLANLDVNRERASTRSLGARSTTE